MWVEISARHHRAQICAHIKSQQIANFLPFDFVLTKKVCTFAVEYRRNVIDDAATTDAPEEAADVKS